jgi:hypothetical protein
VSFSPFPPSLLSLLSLLLSLFFIVCSGLHQLELRSAWHPCVAAQQQQRMIGGGGRVGGSGYIPNDIVLGSEENPARFVLVTGVKYD